MPKQAQLQMQVCNHSFAADPWELQTRRCIYCHELYEDVIPLKLPPKAPRASLNSPLVRALRNARAPSPVRPPWHRLR